MRDILIYNHALINIYSCTVITAVIESLVPMQNQCTCTCILIDKSHMNQYQICSLANFLERIHRCPY